MATKAETKLREILLNTGLVMPIKSSGKGSKVSVLCRLAGGQEKVWLQAVKAILTVANFTKFDVHICRQYVLKDGEMAFGWHIALEGRKDYILDDMLNDIAHQLENFGPGFAIAPEPTIPTPSLPPANRNPEAQKDFLRKHTEASPRQPGFTGFEPKIPEDLPEQKIRVVNTKKDSKTGQEVIEYEMPIPHVYTEDMNKPNAKGKGAWTSDFSPMVGRR